LRFGPLRMVNRAVIAYSVCTELSRVRCGRPATGVLEFAMSFGSSPEPSWVV
jgi:hypothetical protein